MSKTTIEKGKMVVAFILILAWSTACGSTSSSIPTPPQTPLPLISTQVPPTATPIPPTPTLEPPTPTPTSIPVLQPKDYLLTEAELPIELYKSYLYEFQQPDGNIIYSVMFFNPDVGKMINSVIVAHQPYNEVPDSTFWGGTQIEDPMIGQNAKAYLDNSQITYAFFKGNALVTISSELSLEELVNLGKIIETRLPDMLKFSPITFPEQLDTAAFSRYFKSLTLAKQNPGSDELIPTTTFSKNESFCLSMDTVASIQPSAYAIFDVQEKVYVQKFVPESRYYCNPFLGVSHMGQYELRFSINDTLVAILPFEIQ